MDLGSPLPSGLDSSMSERPSQGLNTQNTPPAGDPEARQQKARPRHLPLHIEASRLPLDHSTSHIVHVLKTVLHEELVNLAASVAAPTND